METKQLIALVVDGDRIDVQVKIKNPTMNQLATIIANLEIIKNNFLEMYKKSMSGVKTNE